jgi:eukaryotic-like serine/threonine-protein kinase
MAAHIQQPPRPPIELRANLPGALNEIILLAMAKEPGQRFQTADAFRNALSTVQGAARVAGATASRTPAAAIGVDTMTASFAGVPPGKTAEWISTVAPPLPQPVPVPSVMELSRQQSSNKGKYMALGGLLVVAFLVAAGIYIPRMSKTHADENAARTEQKVSTDGAANAPTDAGSSHPATNAVPPAAAPSNVDAGTPAQNPPAATGDPGNSSPAAQGRNRNAAGGRAAPAIREDVRNAGEKLEIPSGGNAFEAAADTPPPPDNSAALAELEQQVDQLSGRAVAVNDSLDNLRRQQGAQGLGLRGDIASTQERMKIHVGKAQAAVQGRDVESAKKYAAQAEAELEQLEKFLGR